MWAQAAWAVSICVFVLFIAHRGEAATIMLSSESHFSDNSGIVRVPHIADQKDGRSAHRTDSIFTHRLVQGGDHFNPLTARQSSIGGGWKGCCSSGVTLTFASRV